MYGTYIKTTSDLYNSPSACPGRKLLLCATEAMLVWARHREMHYHSCFARVVWNKWNDNDYNTDDDNENDKDNDNDTDNENEKDKDNNNDANKGDDSRHRHNHHRQHG